VRRFGDELVAWLNDNVSPARIAALNAFTRILADAYRADRVLVNAVDPGGPHGHERTLSPRSPQEGDAAGQWPKGAFFRDRPAIEC